MMITKRLFKIIRWTFLTALCLLIFWIIGLVAELPLIPWIVTDYFVAGTNKTLAEGLVIKQKDSTIIKIEVPTYFSEDKQCFDFWFSSVTGKHMLTVYDYTLTAFDEENGKIKKGNSYLFWDEGSKEEIFKIDNYEIDKVGMYDKSKYVFFRTVYNVDNIKNFSLKFDSNYKIDNELVSIDTTIIIQKKHRLTWSKFRVH